MTSLYPFVPHEIRCCIQGATSDLIPLLAAKTFTCHSHLFTFSPTSISTSISESFCALSIMATHGGAADSYYNNGQPQAQFNQGPNQQMYQQGPPNYGQDFQQNNGTPQRDGKQTFAQAFTLDKPKYNDIWAGILVRHMSMDWPRQWLIFAG